MTDLSALIERLEAAPEGSRELDAEIAEAVGYRIERFEVPPDHPVLQGGLEFAVDQYGNRTAVPPFSRSFDAVFLLKPDGWHWEGGCNSAPESKYVWILRGPEDQTRAEGQYVVGFGNEPELAFGAAALRARGET